MNHSKMKMKVSKLIEEAGKHASEFEDIKNDSLELGKAYREELDFLITKVLPFKDLVDIAKFFIGISVPALIAVYTVNLPGFDLNDLKCFLWVLFVVSFCVMFGSMIISVWLVPDLIKSSVGRLNLITTYTRHVVFNADGLKEKNENLSKLVKKLEKDLKHSPKSYKN